MEPHISDLPEEVLVVIFSFLDVDERLNACLVCKHWIETINYKFLLSDINVHVTSTDDINLFMTPTRRFVNFSFDRICIDERVCNLFQALDYAESIKFFECSVDENNSLSVSRQTFMNLKELIVVNFEFPFNYLVLFLHLPNLSKLEISGKNICDRDLLALEKSIESLERLTLHSSIVSEFKVYRRFYPPSLTYEQNPSSDILSIIAIKSFVSKNVFSLSELSLSRISATALKELSEIEGLNLKRISISIEGSESKYYESLNRLFSTQNKLQALQLKSMLLHENVANAILTNLPMLKELSIKQSTFLGLVKDFFQLPQLRQIDIFGTDQSYSNEENSPIIRTIKSTKIKFVNLCSVLVIDSHLFTTKEIQNLSLLTLKNCKITDTDLQAISMNLKNLQFLDVSYNTFISDGGIKGLDCVEGISVCAEHAINNLKSLRYLDLSKCSVTEAGLIDSIEFPSLQSLLIFGYQLSESFFSFINSANPKLKSITDDSNKGQALQIRQKFLNYFSDTLTLI